MFNSQQNRLSREKTVLYVAMRANGDVTGMLVRTSGVPSVKYGIFN
jgi:hypothetical protein